MDMNYLKEIEFRLNRRRIEINELSLELDRIVNRTKQITKRIDELNIESDNDMKLLEK